jgi:hypothetical protein
MPRTQKQIEEDIRNLMKRVRQQVDALPVEPKTELNHLFEQLAKTYRELFDAIGGSGAKWIPLVWPGGAKP